MTDAMNFQQYGNVGARFQQALGLADISDEFVERLRRPKSVLQVSLPVWMDDGRKRHFQGFRIRYNDERGPTKGGVSYHSSLTKEGLISLAFCLTVKCAVCNLPYGGASGGIEVDPGSLSHRELERLSRAYVDALAPFIGSDVDILSPDLNTNETVMAWMVDQLQSIRNDRSLGAITGKPVGRGGTQGRQMATGTGAIAVFETVLGQLGVDPQSLSFAIQGFGSAGGKFASAAFQKGWRIVGVSDSTRAVLAPRGLNIPKLSALKQKEGSFEALEGKNLAGLGDISILPRDELFGAGADVLVPSALANQINADNVGQLRSRYVLELANSPVTQDAEKALMSRGIIIIPDIIANAGGVTTSYFEWVQNRQGISWPAGKVEELLSGRMVGLAKEMLAVAEDRSIPLTLAAHLMGICRLDDAMRCLGLER